MFLNIKKGPFFGIRHVQTLLLFVNKVILFITRFHIQLTLIAMTNAAKTNINFPEYNWTEKHKSYILSSYFVGCLISQLPIVYVIQRFGVKCTLFVITLMSGILNGVVPFCTPWGDWKILCALRFIQGLVESGANPALQQHFANWSPPAERNHLGGFIAVGIDVGLIFAMAMSGLIAQSDMGWPGVFYITAAICFTWCMIWLILGANDVNASRLITKEERAYIEDSLKDSVNFNKTKTLMPWRAILTSKPFWATMFARIGESWGIFAVLAEVPAYLNGIFKVDIAENALVSAAPYLASFVTTFVFMAMAHFIEKKKLLTLTNLRKLLNSISMWLPSAGLIWLGFLDQDQKLLAYILLTVLVSFTTAIIFGSVLSRIEMAPNHAGTVSTITDFISNIAQIIAPIFVGFVVKNESDRHQWQINFAVAALIYCLCDIIFLIWGTSEVQSWNSADFKINKPVEEIFTPKYIKKDSELLTDVEVQMKRF